MDKSNNKFTSDMVVEMLSNYTSMQRKALQLEFEIKQIKSLITEDDMIESMTFNSDLQDKVKGGQAGDKTASIAISYLAKLENINIKQTAELHRELIALNLQIERIRYYINLLEGKYSHVLQKVYIEGLSMAETAELTGISLDTIKRQKNTAIKQLVEMYNYIAK